MSEDHTAGCSPVEQAALEYSHVNLVAPTKGLSRAVRVRDRFTGLWKHPDFVKLWVAQTTSQFGTRISLLAIPLTAVLTLDASAFEMGLLTAVSQAPFLLVGLFVGVWVDRLRRRPILIVADLGRFLLLMAIPLLATLDLLRMGHLYGIVFLVGILTVFFDVANQSYLPALVGRPHLTEANSKVEMSRSVAQFAGPGVGGLLVRLVTAPIAIVLDAATYLFSALFLGFIRTSEPAPAQREGGKGMIREIRDGLITVVGNPLLRPIAGCTATTNLFGSVGRALLVLYATRTLGIGEAMLGVIFMVGGLGALLGASAAASIVERLGVGRTIVASILLGTSRYMLVPLAQGPLFVAVPLLMSAQALGAFCGTVYNINQVSLRQTITPDHLLGRMNASMRFIIWGTIPIGGLLGGVLGEVIGVRPALFVGAVGGLLAVLWVGLSRVRELQEFPSEQEQRELVTA